MIIEASAPLRIGLAGGGTDVPPYSENCGGICLNMAINIRQRFLIEDEPNHHLDNEFFNRLFKELGLSDLFYCQLFSKELIGSGLGSSASAAVAIVAAANKLNKLGLTKGEIAEKAWDIEVNKLGLFGGYQDQFAATYGGLNVFEFGDKVTNVRFDPGLTDRVYENILLFHSGIVRKDTKIQEGLKHLTDDKKRYLDEIKRLAYLSVGAMANGFIDEMGDLMKQSWEFKKKSNNVSTPEIDKIFKKADKLGAWGYKLNGSGGGGTVLFLVDKDKKEKFIEQIGLKHIDFEPDQQGVETRII